MKRGGIILTIILSILALIVGFGGATTALLVTQPAASGSAITVDFEVHAGESFTSVAQRLQSDGLIRNATAFKLLAKLRKKDTGIEQGTYHLSPNMTMSAIMDKLQTGHPDLILAGVNEGWRVAQYDDGFSNLPNFNSDEFDKIVQTGLLPDGTKLSDKYWYVEPKQPNTVDALEGYLYPDHYSFDKAATATDVVETMLNAFGAQLCPGPTGNPDEWIGTQKDCVAHAATVDDKGTTVFAALEKYYDAKSDVHAIYLALTVASITMREIPSLDNTHDIQGIASVYYNRYQHALQNPNYPSADVGGNMEADPTVQYAYATDKPPAAGGTWWPNVNDQNLQTFEAKNLYNTYVVIGLPPGPIAAPLSNVFLAAANPVSPDAGKLYFFFISGKCDHKTYFAVTQAEHDANTAKYITNAQC
jgi:UPF0755 protein